MVVSVWLTQNIQKMYYINYAVGVLNVVTFSAEVYLGF